MVVRLLDGGTSGNTAHRTLLRTQRAILTLVAQSRGRRPKPTPIPSPGTQNRLLLLHALLAGIIPYLAGFLAVLFVRDGATAIATARMVTRLFIDVFSLTLNAQFAEMRSRNTRLNRDSKSL
jgi:hypothetical protein